MSNQEIDVNQKLFWVEVVGQWSHVNLIHAQPVREGHCVWGVDSPLTTQAAVDQAYAADIDNGTFQKATLVELSLAEAAQVVCRICSPGLLAAEITSGELAALRDAGMVTLTTEGIVVNR